MANDQGGEEQQVGARLQPGDDVGERYRVIRLLGEGGIGSVYEAVNTWTGRRVAVKLLQSLRSGGDDALRRFKLEAQTASSLAHPNIVDVLDMGPDPRTGALFIVQELLQGVDLREHLALRGSLSVAETFDVMVPVMGALAAAHARGILHRDVKPENIFLVTGEDGSVTPKLIDFGLAKMLGEDAAQKGRTASGTALGTPAYMAPEQFQGVSDLDARADVWSVGAVLYELLSGTIPFDGPNVMTMLWRASTEPAERIETIAPHVPAEVAALVHAALHVDRARRPESMRAYLDMMLACRPPASDGTQPRSLAPGPSDGAQPRAARVSIETAPTLVDVVVRPPLSSSAGGASRPRRALAGMAAVLLVAAGVSAWRLGPRGAPAARTAVAPAARPLADAPPVSGTIINAPETAADASVAAATPPPAPPVVEAAPRSPTSRHGHHHRPDRATPAAPGAAPPTAPPTAPLGYDPDRLLTP